MGDVSHRGSPLSPRGTQETGSAGAVSQPASWGAVNHPREAGLGQLEPSGLALSGTTVLVQPGRGPTGPVGPELKGSDPVLPFRDTVSQVPSAHGGQRVHPAHVASGPNVTSASCDCPESFLLPSGRRGCTAETFQVRLSRGFLSPGWELKLFWGASVHALPSPPASGCCCTHGAARSFPGTRAPGCTLWLSTCSGMLPSMEPAAGQCRGWAGLRGLGWGHGVWGRICQQGP